MMKAGSVRVFNSLLKTSPVKINENFFCPLKDRNHLDQTWQNLRLKLDRLVDV
jgi:hypothetical protein